MAKKSNIYDVTADKVKALGDGWHLSPTERAERDAKATADAGLRRHTHWVKARYGLSAKRYKAMLEKQGRCCLTCNRREGDLKTRLHVDHNHRTGKVRGLLCRQCNNVLGLVRENPQTLRLLAAYLDFHETHKE